VRRRLIVTTALIAFVALLVAGIPLGVVESRRARSDELTRLEREADGVAAAVDDQVEAGRLPSTAHIVDLIPPGRTVVVRHGNASVRAGATLTGAVLHADSGAARSTTRVTITASASEVRDRQRNVWLLVTGLVLAGTAAAAGLAVWQARRLTRPIERLVRTSDELGAGDFSARSGPLDVPELDRVGRSLDAAAAQIATLVGRQREFAANVSHQLRSPLTGLRLRLDALEAGGADATVREREITGAHEVADRLEATVTDLLTLARAGTAGAPQDVDLAELARDHAGRWEPTFARAGRTLVLDARMPVPARVTPGGVAQALDVLIENGLRHGAGRVTITAAADRVGALLAVSDEGPGIAEGDEEVVFDRDISRSGSTGLGLSLARALVEADGGRLLLASARPPRFEIRVPGRLPAPATPD
jgi:signal transduction histidine kinase